MSVCVINLGLKSMRAAVFDAHGRRLAIAHRPIETQMGEGKVEQRPEDWWSACVDVLDEVLADPYVARHVEALSVTSSAGCLVPMAADGSALGTAIMISDVRASEQARQIEASEALQSLSTTPARVTSDLMLPKIVWLRDHDPARFEAASWFATPNDFLLHRLTGELVTDTNNASKYLFDAGRMQYPGPLLAALGIDERRLPRVVQPATLALDLLGEIRARFHLRRETKAVVATYDAICAVYGAGVTSPGDACDVSGTVTSFRAVTSTPVHDEEGRLFTAPHFADGLYLTGGSNNLGGGVIEWAKQLLYADEVDPYAAMVMDAADAPPGAAGIVFLPYLLGERAPVWDADARAVLFGLGRNHQRSDVIRAIFEGVGYSILDIAQTLADTGIAVERVSVSGGLARLSMVNQIKSDMLGVPLFTPAEIETTALGAGMMAMVSTGRFADMQEAANACVRVDQHYEPDARNTSMYRDFFTIYRSLYTQLRELFGERERLITLHREVLRTRPTYTENL